MRLAIISLPFGNNIGHFMQAHALQTILTQMGHDVTVIDRPHTIAINPRTYPLTMMRRLALRMVGKWHTAIDEELKANRRIRELTAQRVEASKPYFNNRRVIDSFADIKHDDYDGFIIGSDQVWRPGYFAWQFQTEFENAFLQFARQWEVHRVAYAASLGFEEWQIDASTTQACRQLAAKFNAVSVREQSAVELCRNHLGIEAVHVLDPTLLLDSTYYSNLVSDIPQLPEGTIMQYVLDERPELNELVARYATRHAVTTHKVVSRFDDHTAPIEERLMPPFKRWLQGYRDAAAVVTDSFHGTVFSIIFNKPFITISNEQRGAARFRSLLGMFGLEDRLVENPSNVDIERMAPIDWEDVNERREHYHKLSIDFLQRALS